MTWSFENIRRAVLLLLGVAGLAYEIFTPGDARLTLLLTDLVLIGLVPADILISRASHSGTHRGDG